MSCSCCHSTPCHCLPRCPEDCPEVVEKSATNINLTGVGVYDGEVNDEFQFRGISSGDDYIVVTEDAANNAIEITINEATIAGGVPDASETVEGKVELATQAETNTGTDDARVITPLKLANRTATESRAGVIEIATQAEVTTGTDDARAVTPLKLNTYTDSLKTTRTFADDVARAAATPDFVGQLGVQINNSILYSGISVDPGSWQVHPTFVGTVYVTNGELVFLSGTSAEFEAGGRIELKNSSWIDFKTGSLLLDNGITVPANSVLITSSTAGDFSSKLLNEFISTSNTQTGWGTPTGTLDRTTYATYTAPTITNPPTQAEVQAIADHVEILSQHIAAIVTDLKAVKLPAT